MKRATAIDKVRGPRGFWRKLLRRTRREDGQGLVEYGLIIGLVAIALIAALLALNGGLTKIFGTVTTQLNNATTTSSGSSGS